MAAKKCKLWMCGTTLVSAKTERGARRLMAEAELSYRGMPVALAVPPFYESDVDGVREIEMWQAELNWCMCPQIVPEG